MMLSCLSRIMATFCAYTVVLFNPLPTGKFSMIFCRLLDFSKFTFSKNSFRISIRVSNSLDPDQARHFVGPDLDPNWFAQVSRRH